MIYALMKASIEEKLSETRYELFCFSLILRIPILLYDCFIMISINSERSENWNKK